MGTSKTNTRKPNQIVGDTGHNILGGRPGKDILTGGSGADDFLLSKGQDVIQDFDPSEGDQIVLPDWVDLSRLQIKENKDDVILKIKGQLRTKIKDTSLKDVIKSIADKARENALDAIKPEGTDSKQTIINTGLIVQGVNNEITLPSQTGISNVVVFDEENKPLNKRFYTVEGNKVTINKPKGYYKIAAEFDWNNSGSNYLTWMRDVIQFGDKDGDGNADPINAKNAFRLYMGDQITDIKNLSINGSTSTYQMFDAAARFNGNLSHLELDEVTDMYSMFRHTALFNNGGDDGIKNWDTSNVTRMRMTFWNALNFNQNIRDWNVEAVEDEGLNGGMSRMFKNTPKFDQDLSNWSPNIYSGYQTDFNTALAGNKHNKPNRYPNTKLPNFKGESPYDDNETVLRTRNLSRWKEGNKTITLPFKEDEIKEGIIKVQDNDGEDISFTLDGAKLTLPESGANQYTITVTGLAWDNSKYADNNSLLSKKENNLSWLNDVIQFADLGDDGKGDIASGKAAFAGYGGQTISDLDNLDTSELESTRRMFSEAYRFDQDLGKDFLTSNVTDAFAMFSDAGVFNNGGSSSIGEWDTSNVTLMRSMFNKAALFNQELKDWDTSSVRDQAGGGTDLEGGMHNMFRNTPLYEEDLTGWDVEELDPTLNTSFNTKAIKSDDVIDNDEAEEALGKWPLFGQDLDKGDGSNSGGNNNNGGGNGGNGGDNNNNGGGDGGNGDGGGGDGGNGGGGGGDGGNGGGDGGDGGDLGGAPGNGGGPGGDGTIDGKPINPPNDPDNQLRQISVDPSPNKSIFNKFSKAKGRIIGTSKDDKLHGNTTNDTIKGGKGSDYLYGKKGNDVLIGEHGDDVIQGGFGKDRLKGGGGDDVLYGGGGNDRITGGSGKDTYVLSTGRDIVTDFDVNQDAIGLVYALDLTFTQIGNDLQIDGNEGVNTLLLNVDKDDFLANYPSNLVAAPAVEVELI